MKKKLFHILSLAIVLLVTACSEDKTNFVYGDVVDKVTEELIEGCQVSLYDVQGGLLATQLTGADGRWGFEVELGEYVVAFKKENYQMAESEGIFVEYDKTLVKCVALLGTERSDVTLKWIEDPATSFAGGSGSAKDPYLIETSKHLRLVEDYDDQCFKLVRNIDLHYKNWLPIEKLSGTIDGNGYTISNLRVEYDDKDCQYRGLIGQLTGGAVKNLTIQGVNIDGNCSGAVVGYMSGGNIENCDVILTDDSELKGDEMIGGIVGCMNSYQGHVSDCNVESIAKDGKYKINGKNKIGGIIGDGYGEEVTNCRVNCNIIGEKYVGGIIGEASISVENCMYQGQLSGSSYVGGICGYGSTVIACKTVADVECDGDNVGGICGYAYSTIASYVEGSITCDNFSAKNVCGVSTGSVNLCYSTALCEHAAFQPVAPTAYGNYITFSYSVYNEEDIALKMQEAYSDYADYWNFDKCWTWNGVIKGQNKNVRCPRLAWEK